MSQIHFFPLHVMYSQLNHKAVAERRCCCDVHMATPPWNPLSARHLDSSSNVSHGYCPDCMLLSSESQVVEQAVM